MSGHTVHQLPIWNDPAIAGKIIVPSPNSLLFLPEGWIAGQPRPAILFAHRWAGYPYDPTPLALGPLLAEAGYPFLALALLRRGVEGEMTTTPDDDLRYLRYGIDCLSNLGCDQILLVGEEIGAVSVARYAARGGDRRVKGAALIRPFPDLPEWLQHAMGEDRYQEQTHYSGVMNRQGFNQDLVDILVPGPDGKRFLIFQYSPAFLAWWGRSADTRLSRIVPDIGVPVLIAGENAELLRAQAPADGDVRVAPSAENSAVATAIVEWARDIASPVLDPAPMTIVTVTAADGRRLVGTLWQPLEKRRGDLALIHIPGIQGGPLGSPLAKMAPHFVQAGIAAIKIELRRGGMIGSMEGLADEDNEDLDAWIQLLGDLGYPRIVLGGHSLGSITSTRYLARRKPTNIVANFHLQPTGDLGPRTRQRMGEDFYQQVAERARTAVAAGRGNEELIYEFGRVSGADRWRRPTGYPTRAANWLSWWGPDADTVNLEVIREVETPILLIAGTDDYANDPDRMNALEAAATKAPVVTQRWYQGCDHYALGFEDQIAQDLVKWLHELGIRPRLRGE